MNINSNHFNAPTQLARQGKPAVSAQAAPAAPAGDSVTLSGGGVNFQDVKVFATWGVMGATPGLGAATTLIEAAVTAVGHQENASTAAAGGFFANIVGTSALVTGLIIGSNATTLVGAGFLAAAGVAGGYASVANS